MLKKMKKKLLFLIICSFLLKTVMNKNIKIDIEEFITQYPENLYNSTYIRDNHINVEKYLNKKFLCRREPAICMHCCFQK